MPRDAPATSSMTPFFASALRCSSAALADLKPSSRAMSARVGGMPVASILDLMTSITCCCLAVSFITARSSCVLLTISPVCVNVQYWPIRSGWLAYATSKWFGSLMDFFLNLVTPLSEATGIPVVAAALISLFCPRPIGSFHHPAVRAAPRGLC